MRQMNYKEYLLNKLYGKALNLKNLVQSQKQRNNVTLI